MLPTVQYRTNEVKAAEADAPQPAKRRAPHGGAGDEPPPATQQQGPKPTDQDNDEDVDDDQEAGPFSQQLSQPAAKVRWKEGGLAEELAVCCHVHYSGPVLSWECVDVTGIT